MKQLFFNLTYFIGVIIFISSCQTQNKQDKKQNINSDDVEMIEVNNIETTKEEKSIDKNYFKKFDKVELTYYPHSVRSHGIMPACGELIKNGIFEVDSLQKKTTLTKIQIQKFEQLVFTEATQKEWQPSDCFKPRHSLIFYEKEQATHIIEICFDCSYVCYYPDTFPSMSLIYKFNEMENLFNKILKE